MVINVTDANGATLIFTDLADGFNPTNGIDINGGGGAEVVTITDLGDTFGHSNTGTLDIDLMGGADSVAFLGGSTHSFATLTLTGETITNTAALTVSGTTTVNNQGSAIALNLNNASNDFATLIVTAVNAAVDVDDTNGIILGATSASSLTVDAAGTITDSGTINVANNANFDSTNDSAITLNDASSTFGSLTFDGGAVTILQANAMVLSGTSNATTVDLDTTSGSITDDNTANLTVTGNADFNTVDDSAITLNDTYNFGSLTFDGGAVTIVETDATVFRGTSNATSLDLDTGINGISDDSTANVTVTGNANLNTVDDSIILLLDTYAFGSLTFDGGSVVITEADGTLLTGVNDSSDTLQILSGGAITDDPGTTLSVTNNASFADTGGAGITLGDNVTDTVNFGTLTVTSTGAVAVTEDSNMAFSGTNTAGSLTVTSEGTGVGAGNITDGAAADIAVTGLATFLGGAEAADVITIGDSFGNIAQFGSLTFTLTNGAVTISEQGTTPGTLLTGTSTAASLDLDSTGAITDNAGTMLTVTGLADLAGTAITLGDNGGDAIDFGSLTTDTTSGPGNQEITETNGIAGLSLNAGAANNITLVSGGALTDTDGVNDVTAADFIVQADGGIGANLSRVATTVTRMDVRNLTGGAIFITNTGALELADLNAANGAVSGVGGNGEISASSPLTISANAITTGGFTYTATDDNVDGTAVTDDDLTVTGAGTIVRDDTTLSLNAGDDLNIEVGTTVEVTGVASTLFLNIDAGDADAAGATANLFGTINSDGAEIVLTGAGQADAILIDSNGAAVGGTVDNIQDNLEINGGGGSDTLTLIDSSDLSADTVTISNDNPAGGDGTISGLVDAGAMIEFNSVEAGNFFFSSIVGSANGDTVTITPNATTAFFLDGNDPTSATGDTLRLDVTGIANAQLELTPTETGGFVGTLSGTGIANVNFVEFESFDVTGGLVDIVVRIDQSNDAFLTSAPFGLTAGEGFEDDGPGAEDTDTTRVEIDGGGNFQVSVNNTINTATFDITPAAVRSLRIEGSSDNDILLISDAGGLPVVQGTVPVTAPGFADNAFVVGTPGILFNAGLGTDEVRYELDLANGSADVINQTYGVGNGLGAGNTPGNLTGEIRTANATAGLSNVLYFTSLDPITTTGTPGGTLTVLGDNNANTINVTDAAGSFTRVTASSAGNPFEYFDFAADAFNALEIYGMGGADRIDLQSLDGGEDTLTVVRLDGDSNVGGDVSNDTVVVRNTSALVAGTAAVQLFGGAGDDTFILDSDGDGDFNTGGAGNDTVDNIRVGVVVAPATDEGGANDRLFVIDSGGAVTAGGVTVTNNTIDGVTPETTQTDITYGTAGLDSITIFTTANAETVRVNSTAVNTTYNIATGGGGDTVNITSDDSTLQAGNGCDPERCQLAIVC